MNNKAASKRQKILKANSTVFIVVAIAAVIVSFSLVSMRFLWSQKSYNDRVIQKKSEARDQVGANVANLGKLAEQYPDLNSSASTNSTTILHALPPTYDYASLASSIESLAQRSGVSFTGAIGQDDSANAVTSATVSKPIEIPLSLQVSGSYGAINKFIKNVELSIRPISITDVTYSGTNDSLRATVQATTYYQPTRSLDVSRSTVQ
jgi:Tfp pilus assembly protein PilO